MAVRDVLFRRRSVRPAQIGNFGISSKIVAGYLVKNVSREVLPEFYDFTFTKTGCAVYDLRGGGTLFSVDHCPTEGFNSNRDARFKIVDGSVSIPRGAVNRTKSVINLRYPRMSKKSYHYFNKRH